MNDDSMQLMETPKKVVIGFAMQLLGIMILIGGGFIAPRRKWVFCTMDNVEAHRCSLNEHQLLVVGSWLMAAGAIVFLIGFYLEKTGRRDALG